MLHGIFGKQFKTSCENLLCGTSCSIKSTSFSVSLSPSGPSVLTKCPCGYRECRGHWSIATMILWLYNFSACRVSMRTCGIFRSAGMKMWRDDPASTFARIIPQYWRHFLLMIPTILPVGCLSFFPVDSFRIFSFSSSSSVSLVSSALSSRTISLGHDHSCSGRSSMQTTSASIARFKCSRPWMRI